MEKIITNNNMIIAVIKVNELVIKDTQSVLDYYD
jgi:hypothetical protein